MEPEYKWGDIYRMISRREVPDMGLEEAPIYANIEKSAIMKVSTRPELFPCSELMRWVLPHTNHNSMLICNVDGQVYAAFSPGYVALAYHLPEPQLFLTDRWLDDLQMDFVETLKRMLLPGKIFRHRVTEDYDTATLRPTYRFIALMLNRIFGRENGRLFKLEWVPIMFFIATEGTIFNWASIVSSNLSSCWLQLRKERNGEGLNFT